jgi:hypothetical protein
MKLFKLVGTEGKPVFSKYNEPDAIKLHSKQHHAALLRNQL